MAGGKRKEDHTQGSWRDAGIHRRAHDHQGRAFATKDDVRAVLRDVVDEKLKPISDELASIRSDLKELKQKAETTRSRVAQKPGESQIRERRSPVPDGRRH